jgi:hypothetical protein
MFAPTCLAARATNGLIILEAKLPVQNCSYSSFDLRLIVQNNAQQRAVDFDAAVVINEAQLPKLVHEMAHTGPRRADHLRERLLAHLRNDRLGSTFLAKVSQQEKSPCQTLLTRIEQLIDQVLFDPDGPG